MKREFILWENNNVIYYFTLDGDMRFEFKPNCPEKIKKMWELLNKPLIKGE